MFPSSYCRVRAALAEAGAFRSFAALGCSFVPTLLLAAFLLPSLCAAQLLVYQGSLRLDRTGDQAEVKLNYKAVFIIEPGVAPGTAEVAKISYYSDPAGLRVFTVQDMPGFYTNQVCVAPGRTNTVVAQAQTVTNANYQPTVTASFLSGSNSKLMLTTTTTTTNGSTITTNKPLYLHFPAILNWSSRGVTPGSGGGGMSAWQELGVLTFDSLATLTNNNNTQTVSNVKASVAAGLRQKGYLEVVPLDP